MGRKKLDYNDVKKSFNKEGYILLSKEYKNANQYLYFICPKGHKHKIIWSSWKGGHRCGKCFSQPKHNIKKIKESFTKEGYILLSKEYKNKNEYLDFICPNGHKHKIVYSAWKKGHRCGICAHVTKLTYNSIKESFEKEGYVLLSKEYINTRQYVDFICPLGHKHKIRISSWNEGRRCGICSNKNKITYEHVKESFEKEGYILLSKEYINNITYLDYICPKGYKHKITWGSWKGGHRCPCVICNPNGKSKPEKEIVNYIKNNYNGIIKENDRKIIKNPKTGWALELDIYLPEIKKAIEYNGEYWHRSKYSKWKDQYKKRWCDENNIDLLIINHEDWVKNKDWCIISKFIV